MAAGDILDLFGSANDFGITLGALANGSARQSDFIDNTALKWNRALIYTRIRSGSVAPTAGQSYAVHLLRRNAHVGATVTDDGAGDSDAAIVIENAPTLGAMIVTATINKYFYAVFDTAPLGPLGPSWAIAIRNNSGQAMEGTSSFHLAKWIGVASNVSP